MGATSDPVLGEARLDSTWFSCSGTASKALFRAQCNTNEQVKLGGFHKQQDLENSFEEIREFASRLGLSKILIDSARQYYVTMNDKTQLFGRKKTVSVVASVYMACRDQGVSRSAKELASTGVVTEKEVKRAINEFKKCSEHTKSRVYELESQVLRACQEMDLPLSVRNKCVKVSDLVSYLITY